MDVWHAVSKVIETRIEESRDLLERATGDDVIRIQARIRVFRDVLAMPDALKKSPESLIGDGGPAFPS